MTSTHQDILSERMFTMLSDQNVTSSTFKNIFETLWSAISSNHNRIEIVEEQLALIGSRSQINSKLSQKVSLDEMMGCLDSVNQVLKKKVGEKEVIDIVKKYIPPSDSTGVREVEKLILQIRNEILSKDLTIKQKFKQMEINSKWQCDYLYKKIQSLREEVTVVNNQSKTLCTQLSETSKHRISLEEIQECSYFNETYEKFDWEIHNLKSKQQESVQTVSAFVEEISRIVDGFQRKLECVSLGSKQMNDGKALKAIEIESTHNQLQSRITKVQMNLSTVQTLSLLLNKLVKQNQSKPKFAKLQEFKKLQNEMNIIYKSLCYQNIVGRWGYKHTQDNTFHDPQTIVWQYQLINTLIDNFIWTKNAKHITIRSKGIYEIIFSGFAKRGVNVKYKIRINGKIFKQKEEEGQKGGTMVREIVCVDDNSRIGVEVEGKTEQGVLWFKRL